jgi:hypothetical protein
MATRSSAAQMLRVVREVDSVASSIHETDAVSSAISLNLEILDVLAADPFDAAAVLVRLVAHAYRD